VRLSTGLEDAEDLIEDLRQALDAVVVKTESHLQIA
jgi:cystathionine beta-lyase/cystathionine gamma-synthase